MNAKVKLEIYPAKFEFKNTIGHRAVLGIRSEKQPLSSSITNADPEYTKVKGLRMVNPNTKKIFRESKPLDKTKTAKISAELVNEFLTKSHAVLDQHEVNQKRLAAKQCKANIILTRDSSHTLPHFPDINDKYKVNFVSLTDMPVERGISKLVGMNITVLPPPSSDLQKDCACARVKQLLRVLPRYDSFYIHIKGPDERGHDGKFNRKAQLISIIDKHFLGKFLKEVKLENFVICVTADHATPCKLMAHSDDPVPLLITSTRIKEDAISNFSEKLCRNGSLGILERGCELMPKLIDLIKT